jgi:uncharacterized protein YjbI with pentapeptide repeats
MLYSDLKDLGNLIYIKISGKNKTSSLSKSSLSKSSLSKSSLSKSSLSKSSLKFDKASGVHNKTRKIREPRTNISFQRKPKQKRFKNPLFLSLK